MGLIGTHLINLRIPKNSEIGKINFNQTIVFEELQYTFDKKFGTDTWVLNVGEVFSETLGMINCSKNSDTNILLSNLKILRFKKGIMQWSTHKITIGFDFQLIKNEQSIVSGYIESSGTGNGREFGMLTFIPIAGNINFDKGIEVALFRSIELGLSRLQAKINTQF